MLNGAGEACDVASTFPSVNGRSLTIAVQAFTEEFRYLAGVGKVFAPPVL
jgi:hypothetical protein